MEKHGDCYRWALWDAVNNGGELVHGWIVHPIFGTELTAHAWVERDGQVYDWQRCEQGMGDCPISVEEFYQEYQPQGVAHYPGTPKLVGRVHREGNWGPWHPEPWTDPDWRPDKKGGRAHYRRNADVDLRGLERAASAGDPEAWSRLIRLRERAGQVVPRRNLELACYLQHPGARHYAASAGIEIRDIIFSPAVRDRERINNAFTAVVDNLFYAPELFWGLYTEELKKISTPYHHLVDDLHPDDALYFIEVEDDKIIPRPWDIRTILRQARAILQDLRLVKIYDPTLEEEFGEEFFTPQQRDFFKPVVDYNRMIALEFEADVSENYHLALESLANALGSLYYYTGDNDISTDFLYTEEYIGVLSIDGNGISPGIVAISQLVNSSTLAFSYLNDYYGITKPDTNYYQGLANSLAVRLLNDFREIPPRVEALFDLV